MSSESTLVLVGLPNLYSVTWGNLTPARATLIPALVLIQVLLQLKIPILVSTLVTILVIDLSKRSRQ